jgi:hypothetical protein
VSLHGSKRMEGIRVSGHGEQQILAGQERHQGEQNRTEPGRVERAATPADKEPLSGH